MRACTQQDMGIRYRSELSSPPLRVSLLSARRREKENTTMDEKMINGEIADDIRADFDEFVAKGDWHNARAALVSLEDMNVDTRELRRRMNIAMAKEEAEEKFQEASQKREEWLDEHMLFESDVMEDEQGEYVFLDEEHGLRKTYLPNELDLNF